jgi:hypothetical protein
VALSKLKTTVMGGMGLVMLWELESEKVGYGIGDDVGAVVGDGSRCWLKGCSWCIGRPRGCKWNWFCGACCWIKFRSFS